MNQIKKELDFLENYWNFLNVSIEDFSKNVKETLISSNQISKESLERFVTSMNAETEIKKLEKQIQELKNKISVLSKSKVSVFIQSLTRPAGSAADSCSNSLFNSRGGC